MTLTVAIYRNGMSWTRPDPFGARSCMNKPALWADVASKAAA